ncbi:Hypothetical predicted protein [Lecanosticta acicola]|uniref:SET domain-containing protein n=1 Tax=Lecanosticta acicola TaxID=111012 RepID=A0AAI8Z4U2_9PEZI|nr:Hypothetical predicted protein [Lecanosticta acicola]
MIVRRGKQEGWLHLDVDAVQKWAAASGIKFTNASPTFIPGRGIGLLADHDIRSEPAEKPCQILELAEDLVLSIDAVKQHASFDKDFRELLESLGEFGTTPRGSILSFLLFQATISCPNLSERVGVHTAFTDYVKTLPCEILPTFWTSEELQLLVGTTLAPAVSSKLKSLQREYDLLYSSAANTRWFKLVEPFLDLDDWMQVDAMFRSRALDFYGSCMIPGMDLASHAAGDRTSAFYDRNEGSYFLRLMEGKELKQGDEICITYGDEKGACEMLFSYGFIEEQMDTAETLFLSLMIPDSDVSKSAKMKVADCAPGFKIIDVCGEPVPAEKRSHQNEETGGDIDWSGDFIWLLCVGSEDGLEFELARTVDGQEELQATFNGQELKRGASDLHRHLVQSQLWPVYRLRAMVILQQRVFDQLQVLYGSQDAVEATPHGDGTGIREPQYQQALKLRSLEFELLNKAYEDFEKQKIELAETSIVQQYLTSMGTSNTVDEPVEDFS